uniref:tigger transposable element-derived protein 1-like n=1 Tax=Myxine glutinosa TaxID=7769 RepID=UPI0035902DA6
MSSKHNVGADEIAERKRQRKVMSLLEKVDVLDKLTSGMEKALCVWVEDETQKGMSLSGAVVREKAMRLYKHYVDSEGAQKGTFIASIKGWFENFKKRMGLHNIKRIGEATSADHVAAREYQDKFGRIIEKNSYLPEQVFNLDETGLFWKKMPSRTSSDPNIKVANLHRTPPHSCSHLTRESSRPPRATSLLQPLDQGIIPTSKSYYTRRTFRGILDASENETFISVSDCWKSYSIADCLMNIKESLDEFRSTTLNGCWRKLWPEAVHDFQGFPIQQDEIRNILVLARQVKEEGFADLEEADIVEVLESHDDELTEEDLEELAAPSDKEDDRDSEGIVERPQLTISTVKKGLQMADDLVDHLFEVDHFMERCLKLKREMDTVMAPSKEVYKDMQTKAKQMKITSFFTKPDDADDPT